MPPFTVNPHRFDPYKNFKFRIKWDGKYVAGIAASVSPLTCVTDVIEYREGGDPSASRKSPGRTKYEPITLERGVTHDPEFEQWADQGLEPYRRRRLRRCRCRTSARTSRSSSTTKPGSS